MTSLPSKLFYKKKALKKSGLYREIKSNISFFDSGGCVYAVHCRDGDSREEADSLRQMAVIFDIDPEEFREKIGNDCSSIRKIWFQSEE